MKKAITLTLSVMIGTASFFAITSFSNHGNSIFPSSSKIKADQPSPVTIEITRGAGGVRTFVAHGAINTSGKWTMDVRRTGKAFHCINTLTAVEGTIVAISHCNGVTMNGVWQITSGSGAYAGIEGNGSLMMHAAGESWEGSIR